MDVSYEVLTYNDNYTVTDSLVQQKEVKTAWRMSAMVYCIKMVIRIDVSYGVLY